MAQTNANKVFHPAVADAVGNLKVLLDHVPPLDVRGSQKGPGWTPHHDILKAVEARNPDEARMTMATHTDSSRDRMLKLFGGCL